MNERTGSPSSLLPTHGSKGDAPPARRQEHQKETGVGPMPAEVKEADTRLLLDEHDALRGPSSAHWDVDGEPFGVHIEAWSPERAEAAYLSRFSELTGRQP